MSNDIKQDTKCEKLKDSSKNLLEKCSIKCSSLSIVSIFPPKWYPGQITKPQCLTSEIYAKTFNDKKKDTYTHSIFWVTYHILKMKTR